MMKLKLMIFLFHLTLYSSCSQIPCFDSEGKELYKLHIKNGAAPWNCGLLRWEANKSELDSLCALFGKFTESNRVNDRGTNHYRLDIYYNDLQEKIFYDNLELLWIEDFGYMFIFSHKYYKNEELANFIIYKMKINTYKFKNDHPCD